MYYDRLFPTAVRSMVLDSVFVNQPDVDAAELVFGQRAMDRIFAECRNNPHCIERFGSELENDFYHFLEQLEARKPALEIQWPGASTPVSIPLTGSLVVNTLHTAMYSTDTLADIPLTISQLIAGNFDRFRADIKAYFQSYSPDYTFSDTAFLTYQCGDKNFTEEGAEHLDHLKLVPYWEFKQGQTYMQSVCDAYGIRALPDILARSYSSDTLTLFLSGELDPVTPPENADKAAASYRYQWHFTEPYASHDVISHSQCARYLTSWFFYHPQEDLALKKQQCGHTPRVPYKLE